MSHPSDSAADASPSRGGRTHQLRSSSGRLVALLGTEALRPHEQHDESWARRLADQISGSGLWTTPIVVEPDQRIVLDGHHRRRAAQLLRLACVPAVLVPYDDPGVTLTGWRAEEVVSRSLVLQHALSGSLLPIRTTRHAFSPEIGVTAIPLRWLAAGS